MDDSHRNGHSHLQRLFGAAASHVARAAGRPAVFALAVSAIVVWAVTGPIYDYSETWQLVINTGTTIVTFLMVFLIQNSQNRDGAAIQVTLDELIRVSTVENTFVGIEHLTDDELDQLRTLCEARAKSGAVVGEIDVTVDGDADRPPATTAASP